MDPKIPPVHNPAVYCVVQAIELEARTRAGWKLVQVLHDNDLEVRSDSVAIALLPNPTHYNSGVGQGVEMRYHVVARVQFLLALDEESITAALTRDLAAQRQALTDAAQATKALQDDLNLLKRANVTKADEIVSWRTRYNDLTTRADALKTAKDRLEVDLGKIRAMIGEKAFKEALDGTTGPRSE